MAKEFIKVTCDGVSGPRVVKASLEAFYRNRKAKIEEPTQEEILAAFPELAASKQPQACAELEQAKEVIKELQDENSRLLAANNSLEEELEQEREKNKANTQSLEEAENLIKQLKAESKKSK